MDIILFLFIPVILVLYFKAHRLLLQSEEILVEVASNQPVEISARLNDLDGTVQEGRVYYSVDQGQRFCFQMTFSASDTLYKATIPGVTADSAVVDFYIWAKDNDRI